MRPPILFLDHGGDRVRVDELVQVQPPARVTMWFARIGVALRAETVAKTMSGESLTVR
ncbi:hypothetical protein Cci01nite_33360 [Catellatospora citrea]|uniref:Uncharacterized protein n=1 Tax=Catellatospora citrea TaxID=53366 RepID=A0A8J3KEF7_9ACTN|nr:hypothetical protein Cci01nite_33360 [Catellatospora citrea]